MKSLPSSLVLSGFIAFVVSLVSLAVLSPRTAPPQERGPDVAALEALHEAIDGLRADLDALRIRAEGIELAGTIREAADRAKPEAPAVDPREEEAGAAMRAELDGVAQRLVALEATAGRIPPVADEFGVFHADAATLQPGQWQIALRDRGRVQVEGSVIRFLRNDQGAPTVILEDRRAFLRATVTPEKVEPSGEEAGDPR